MTNNREVIVSVDVETSGPIPGEYSMLSIGACLVDDDTQVFSSKLKPLNLNADPKALEVTGLSMTKLMAEGEEPATAMQRFDAWLAGVTGEGAMAVFVGFNAAFDWSFVNYYFHRFTGANPFGFAALDIKSFYMGAAACAWGETRSSRMQERLRPQRRADHDAVHDAIYQAELFGLARGLKTSR